MTTSMLQKPPCVLRLHGVLRRRHVGTGSHCICFSLWCNLRLHGVSPFRRHVHIHFCAKVFGVPVGENVGLTLWAGWCAAFHVGKHSPDENLGYVEVTIQPWGMLKYVYV